MTLINGGKYLHNVMVNRPTEWFVSIRRTKRTFSNIFSLSSKQPFLWKEVNKTIVYVGGQRWTQFWLSAQYNIDMPRKRVHFNMTVELFVNATYRCTDLIANAAYPIIGRCIGGPAEYVFNFCRGL